MATTLTLQELYKPVEQELDAVRNQVDGLWAEMLGLVDGVPAECPASGGKLLRPALCLLSAGAVGVDDRQRFVSMATAMELFHIAALAHDDVVDSAELRRGAQSLNALWDNHAAVLGGDYLVAQGVQLLTQYRSTKVIDDAAECIRHMARGELAVFGRNPAAFTQDRCLELARAKTASLFAVACATPSRLMDESHFDALSQFGLELGVAFQLVDDLLDLVQDEVTLGKPSCGDLAGGKTTLPILFLREELAGVGLARFEAVMNAPPASADRQWVAEALETTGARDRTETVAREHVDRALSVLGTLPATAYREAMAGLSEFVLIRGS